jgi:3-isopropylmalate/(R)-2-methylmalate dehydratase small subunit
MKAFTTFTSPVVVVPAENIDTDQIIPARFLKTTERAGLGKALFTDWRYNADGSPKPDFPLNRSDAPGAEVLLAGDNFGCGSSREHAPWALADFGFRAIISTSFADIFRNNALKNGLLPVAVEPDAHQRLLEMAAAGRLTVTIDLEQQEVILPDGIRAAFPIDPFARTCLLEGVDELGYVLRHDEQIEAYEAVHPGRVNTIQA